MPDMLEKMDKLRSKAKNARSESRSLLNEDDSRFAAAYARGLEDAVKLLDS